MKVLIYRYQSICEPDVIEAFKELGAEVFEYTREIQDKDLNPGILAKYLGEYLQENPVDFIFSINFFPHVAEVCNVFRIPYLSWIVDSPILELFSTAVTREWNRIFIFDKAFYRDIEKLNPGRVFYLPLAANVKEKDKLFKKTKFSVKKHFVHDLAFVGSLYTEKCPYDQVKNLPEEVSGYFDGIMRAQERIHGYYFAEDLVSDEKARIFKDCFPDFYTLPEGSFLTDKYTLTQHYMAKKISSLERISTFKLLSENFPLSIYTASDTRVIPKAKNLGTCKTLTEMPLVFNGSTINLNITSKSIRTGIPLRVFDILSCGGFLITNYQEEIPELFVPGEELIMYTNREELLYLVDYYLNHKKEAEEIAHNGREAVLNNFTYIQQIQRMLLSAFKE